MFLLPIDNDAVRRGKFPWFTALLIATCLGIHGKYGAIHERHVELQLLQEEPEAEEPVPTTTVDDSKEGRRAARAAHRAALAESARRASRQHELERELGEVSEQDLIARWAFQPSDIKHVLDAGPGLITHAFVHGSWFHVLSNMLMLYLLGVPLERRFGLRRISSLYFSGIIAGALGYWALHYGTKVSMVGASGAVAALMGAFLVFFHRSVFTFFYVILLVIYPWWGTIRAPAMLFLPLWIGLEVLQLVSEGAALSMVAHSAHVAGFLSGAVIALVWKLPAFTGTVIEDGTLPAAQRHARELRSRYRDLRGLVTANPRDLARRAELLLVSLELGEVDTVARDLPPLAQALAGDPSRLVALYRGLREHSPALEVPPQVLLTVNAAAVAADDHAVVIETTRKCMELSSGAAPPALLQAVASAAASQDALGDVELAAQTRSFLWSLGFAPSAAAPPAPERSSARSARRPASSTAVLTAGPTQGAPGRAPAPGPRVAAPIQATAVGRRTCASHNLVAIGTCSQCEVAVCAACSKARSSSRLCRDCHANVVAARGEFKHAEANLHAFGVLWQMWGLALLACVPAVMLLPPDHKTGFEKPAAVIFTLMAAAFFLFGRALAQLRPWAFWPAVCASVLLLFQAPIGTLVGALTLNILFRSTGRRAMSREYARLRELSRELDPRFSAFTRQLLMWSGGLFGLLLLAGYTFLIREQIRGRRMPPPEVIQASIYRPWKEGATFRYRATTLLTTSRPAATEAFDTRSRMSLEGEAEVLAVDDKGWPIEVAYLIDRFAIEVDGEAGECREIAVLANRTGALTVRGKCGYRLREVLAPVLLPSPPKVGDGEVFAIERGHVTPGRSWQADVALLQAQMESAQLRLDDAKPRSGTLEVTGRESCGWATCLVFDRSAKGDIVNSQLARYKLPSALRGSFTSSARALLPARPELVSFGLVEVLDYRVGDPQASSTVQTHTEIRREVMASGENVTFDDLSGEAAPLARAHLAQRARPPQR